MILRPSALNTNTYNGSFNFLD